MANRAPFQVDPRWNFSRFLTEVFAYYRGIGIESTGRRLTAIRTWLAMSGRTRALESLRLLEEESNGASDAEIAESLWMAESSYKTLKRWAENLPDEKESTHKKAFISYKWESGEHVAWVRKLAADLRGGGIEAILDQWEVRLGESFTDYMQRHIAESDVILFVITPGAVAAAEAPKGEGGALKFEVQMMNARRMAEGVRIIGIYRSGDRPPHYLRDHRYVDFRNDTKYGESLRELVNDLLDKDQAPPVIAPSVSTTDNARIEATTSTPSNAEVSAKPFSRKQLEEMLPKNAPRDLELTNGLWVHIKGGNPQRTQPQGPIRAGLVDDESFEVRIPHGSLWCLRVPYALVHAAWTTNDGKIALRLNGRPVLYKDGFHLETSDA